MNSIGILFSLINDFIKNEKNLNDDFDNNYRICRDICKHVVESCNVPVIVNGKENIPKDDSLLICSNHISFYDIFALVSCIDRSMSFAAAKELMKYPLLKKYITAINCVLIDRQTEEINVMKKQLQDMEDAIKRGGLILFPEGECSYLDDEIKPFKKGGFMAASKLDTKIIPTYIRTDKMKKMGKWYIPTDEVEITFGEPFIPSVVFDGKASAKKVSEYTREKVLELKKF